MLQQTARIEDRTKAMLRARLRADGLERDACIVDVSSRGMLLMAANPPSHGRMVEVVVGPHTLLAQVKWSSARRFGLAFRERISVVGLLSGESGAITLQRRAVEAKRRSRMRNADGNVLLGYKLQFGVVVLAVLGAAIFFAGYAGEGLASLSVARDAMAGNSGR
ncbi:MAG: PilZ domain-containing protein [Novosphingobium sp.]|nr:PilZ domain-containing protein [Novosphingobium sp.]